MNDPFSKHSLGTPWSFHQPKPSQCQHQFDTLNAEVSSQPPLISSIFAGHLFDATKAPP
jgi:hypothetical protein